MDIYAIGSALVDYEAAIDEQFLGDHGIDKGVMTLVESDRQAALVEAITARSKHLQRSCGGSSCNTAVAASLFGSQVIFSGKVANDEDGHLFLEDLRASGVSHPEFELTDGVTGKCLVMVTPDADRTMNTYLGISIDLRDQDLDLDRLAQSTWLYIEGYLVTDEARTEVVKRAVAHAKANGVKVAVSLSDPFVVAVFGEQLRAVIGAGVDLLFCNLDEAQAFTSTDSLQAAADALKQSATQFAITLGAEGSYVFDGETGQQVAGVAVTALDTNGAGDMFAGAFLSSVIDGADFAAAAAFANRCASEVVAQYGPRLPVLEYERLASDKPKG